MEMELRGRGARLLLAAAGVRWEAREAGVLVAKDRASRHLLEATAWA